MTYSQAREVVRTPPCDVARVVGLLADPALVADLTGTVPTARIVLALQRVGVVVSTPAVTAHRARDCACAEEIL